MGAYMRFFYNDFRLNCEDPPLFGYWAMLPHNAHTLKLDMTLPQWQQIPEFIHLQWIWCVMMLAYRMPPNDPDAFINASRADDARAGRWTRGGAGGVVMEAGRPTGGRGRGYAPLCI